jgi:uncharacterized protein
VRVGGRYGDGDSSYGDRQGSRVLLVRVTARAVDGQATAAVLAALAEAFDVPRRRVTLVSGATARTKVVDIDGPEQELEQRYAALLEG